LQPPATIDISGFDLAGNPGALTNTSALTIISGAPALPLGGAGVVALLLALSGVAAVRRRR